MEQIIKIEKKNAADIVCWKEDASNLTPNTTIELASGLVAVINADGKRKVQTQLKSTVFGLFNLNKDKKFFGGNKAYKGNCEICVIDKSSEFKAEWGFGDMNPIACKDMDFNVDCEAVAVGMYTYQISDYSAFISSIPMKNDVITRSDIREFLRVESSGVISACLAEQLLANGMSACKANIAAISDVLAKRINSRVESKGLYVTSVTIMSLDYTKKWKAAHEHLDTVTVVQTIHTKENEIVRDDISLGKSENEVILPRIKAIGDAQRRNEPHHNGGRVTYCHACGEQNVDADYCKKCGTKLHKDQNK